MRFLTKIKLLTSVRRVELFGGDGRARLQQRMEVGLQVRVQALDQRRQRHRRRRRLAFGTGRVAFGTGRVAFGTGRVAFGTGRRRRRLVHRRPRRPGSNRPN